MYLVRQREARAERAFAIAQAAGSLYAEDIARLATTVLPVRLRFTSTGQEVVLLGRRISSPLTDLLDLAGERGLRNAGFSVAIPRAIPSR